MYVIHPNSCGSSHSHLLFHPPRKAEAQAHKEEEKALMEQALKEAQAHKEQAHKEAQLARTPSNFLSTLLGTIKGSRSSKNKDNTC